ncbi:MAG: hypothetical protein V1744_06450, partial [Candidatus Altiarchaeota archaeon]
DSIGAEMICDSVGEAIAYSSDLTGRKISSDDMGSMVGFREIQEVEGVVPAYMELLSKYSLVMGIVKPSLFDVSELAYYYTRDRLDSVPRNEPMPTPREVLGWVKQTGEVEKYLKIDEDERLSNIAGLMVAELFPAANVVPSKSIDSEEYVLRLKPHAKELLGIITEHQSAYSTGGPENTSSIRDIISSYVGFRLSESPPGQKPTGEDLLSWLCDTESFKGHLKSLREKNQ